MISWAIRTGELGDAPVTKVQVLSMLCMVAGLAAVVIGALKFKWGADKISATFLVVCLLIGCVSCKDITWVSTVSLKAAQVR